jgi:carbon monoxide dehydrogenase subunit G
MKLENEFTVPASIDEAWAFLLDVPRVAPCLPGATVEDGGGDDGEYQGTMKIKIGPITAQYKGTVKIESQDEAAHKVAMRAQAKDARGQGTAAATITSTMEETSDGTKVHVETDMRVTGPAAQFGRGVMQDVSAKLMGRFADCLAEEIAGATPAPPAAEEAGGAAAAARPEPPPGPAGDSAEAAARGPERRAPEVLDLGEASREAVLKRAAPVVGAALVLLILLRIIRR